MRTRCVAGAVCVAALLVAAVLPLAGCSELRLPQNGTVGFVRGGDTASLSAALVRGTEAANTSCVAQRAGTARRGERLANLTARLGALEALAARQAALLASDTAARQGLAEFMAVADGDIAWATVGELLAEGATDIAAFTDRAGAELLALSHQGTAAAPAGGVAIFSLTLSAQGRMDSHPVAELGASLLVKGILPFKNGSDDAIVVAETDNATMWSTRFHAWNSSSQTMMPAAFALEHPFTHDWISLGPPHLFALQLDSGDSRDPDRRNAFRWDGASSLAPVGRVDALAQGHVFEATVGGQVSQLLAGSRPPQAASPDPEPAVVYSWDAVEEELRLVADTAPIRASSWASFVSQTRRYLVVACLGGPHVATEPPMVLVYRWNSTLRAAAPGTLTPVSAARTVPDALGIAAIDVGQESIALVVTSRNASIPADVFRWSAAREQLLPRPSAQLPLAGVRRATGLSVGGRPHLAAAVAASADGSATVSTVLRLVGLAGRV